MSGRGRLPAGFLDVLDAVGWFANRSEGSLPGRLPYHDTEREF
jgi:hypothetical protein